MVQSGALEGRRVTCSQAVVTLRPHLHWVIDFLKALLDVIKFLKAILHIVKFLKAFLDVVMYNHIWSKI